MNKKIWMLWAFFAVILFVCNACGKEPVLLEEYTNDGWQETTENAVEETVVSETVSECLCVHICGAVATPGVYELPYGSRIYEAVNQAGGFDELADREAVNLVELLTDGQQVRIPFMGETDREEGSGLIDINRADIAMLCEIPGIGEGRAQAILDYREEHGAFQSIEELMQVPGIKEGIFARISSYVECGD